MKKIILAVLIISPFLFSQKTAPVFSELRGMEDNSGNTHLLYRLLYENDTQELYNYNNSVYHFDLTAMSDTLFLSDFDIFSKDFSYESHYETSDFDFWDNDPTKYIAARTACGGAECGAFIEKYSNPNDYYYWDSLYISTSSRIEISPFNDSIIFASIPELVKSFDGGETWSNPDLESPLYFAAFSPFDTSTFFVYNSNGQLLRSDNNGLTYTIADTLTSTGFIDHRIYYGQNKLIFDPDGTHVYRIAKDGAYMFYLSVSQDSGKSFSSVYKSSGEAFIANGNGQSGVLFLAYSNRILRSNDYGSTFTEFLQLDRKVTGIYKKLDSDKLYAATKYNLYEVTENSIVTLKHLQPDSSVFRWLPLEVGNKWVYDGAFYGDGWFYGDKYVSVWEAKGSFFYEDKYYTEIETSLEEMDEIFSAEGRTAFRIDSGSGYVFAAIFNDDSLLREWFYVDLSLEPDEESHPFGYETSSRCYSIVPWEIFDSEVMLKDMSAYEGHIQLAKNLGIYYYYGGGLTQSERRLKGAVINGIVYGDTTVVGVEEENNIPREFSLSQNYPNPFNPSTVINYSLPHSSKVELIVYDVLGKEVAKLVNEEKPAGEHSIEFDAAGLSSGIYLYQLKAGDFVSVKKLVLLK